MTSLNELNVEAAKAIAHTYFVGKITIAVAKRDFILSKLSNVRIWRSRPLRTGAETHFDRWTPRQS